MRPSEIYLDWNATTPPHPDVLARMLEAQREAWANPASVHAAGRRARAVVDDARDVIASALQVHARDVLFTASATEANNLALRHALGLATSRIEHPSVVRSAEQLELAGIPVAWLPVTTMGTVEPEAVASALSTLPAGSTVAVMAANHETGVVQPLGAIAEQVRRAGGRLHVDAVQALGKCEPALWQGADSVAIAAHKLRGPKGIGALAWRGAWIPKPVLVGGAQERGLRPGTVDATAAAGFGAAVARVPELVARYAELAVLRDRIEAQLSAFGFVNGGGALRLPHVTNLSFEGWRGDELVAALDLAGVRVSSGSACSAGTTEPSPVITAMLGEGRATAAVRISLGEDTTPELVDEAITVCRRLLALQASSSSSDG
jgi:cysteine desulfurase